MKNFVKEQVKKKFPSFNFKGIDNDMVTSEILTDDDIVESVT